VHVDLDEGAGQLFRFPRRGRLARAQPDDHVLPAGRLAGTKSHVLDDSVALVEDSEDRDALRHRSDAALPGCRHRHVLGRPRSHVLLLRALAACAERERNHQRCRELSHAYSGIQGS
jgi:hypothetical protein